MSIKIIENRRPGECASCHKQVNAYAGKAFTSGDGWRVACLSRACHEALGLIQDNRRVLTADGKVITPKDSAALPLIRAMPGARWDKVALHWTVSLAIEDRPRLLEIADQLRLDVAQELRDFAPAASEVDADQRASREGLYPFQREGVRFLARHDRALLADDMGLGKTIQALCALPTNKPAIVVCPASLKLNWRDECRRWRPDLMPVVLEGRKAFRAPTGTELLIVNDDILPAWLIPSKDAGRFVPPVVPAGFESLKDATLIYDEAHRGKNYKAARSRKVSSLSRLCARAWLLTGTPLMNQPTDLWGVLSTGDMSREVFGSFATFGRLFGAHTVRHGRSAHATHTEYSGPQGPEPAERLRRVMLRRTKQEALPDLPRKVYSEHPVNGLSKSLRSLLDDLEGEWTEVINATDDLPPFEEFSEVRAALAEAVIPALMEIVESHEEQATPLVVFSAHRAPIDALGTREGWATITGDTSLEARHTAVHSFQAGTLKGIALTIQAGGVGITLTRASRVLFADLDWTPALNAQAEDRCCRIGQTASSVQVTRMVGDHPLCRHILRLLSEKQRLIEKSVETRAQYIAPGIQLMHGDGLLTEETREAMEARKTEIENAAREVNLHARRQRAAQWVSGSDVEGRDPPASNVLDAAYEHMVGRCDGAIERDRQGFNKPDAARVHFLAAFAGPERDRALWMILRGYSRQLRALFPAVFA